LPLRASCKHIRWRETGIPTPNSSPETSPSPNLAFDQGISNHPRTDGSNQSQTVLFEGRACSEDSTSETGNSCLSDGPDLAKTGIVCSQLILDSSFTCPGATQKSLGYLGIAKDLRFVLHAGVQNPRIDSDSLITRKITSLHDLLKLPVYDVISDQDRVELALILVKSALKYYSTPWWPDVYAMQHVFFFHAGEADLSASLDTLHLTTQLDCLPSSSMPISPSPSIVGHGRSEALAEEAVKYAMENHGIRNLTLYGLGVALLQIGLWDHVPWEDHVQVRRKTARLSYLGLQYRNATKRLIDCDFGLATENLHDTQLQAAIFDSIVGDLEALLAQVQV